MQPSNLAVRSPERNYEGSSPPERLTVSAARPLGHVVSVNGSRAVIALDSATHSRQHGQSLSVGKLVSIDSGASRAIGLIFAAETAGHGAPASQHGTTLLSVELTGEIQVADSGSASFDRGIRNYPSVGAAAYPLDPFALETIYKCSGGDTIVIGRLAQDERIEARLKVRDLLQKHFAVLGTTGCGKSSAIALILHEVLRVGGGTRVLLIDPHNEYKSAFGDSAEVVSPRNLSLPYWLFNFEELIDVIYRRRPGVAEEIDTLADLIPLAKARYAQGADRSASLLRRDADDGGHTVDSPVPYRMADVIGMIDEQLGKLDGKDDRPKLRRLRSRIQSVVSDSRYRFIFAGRTIDDTMSDLLATLFRIPVAGKPITIVEMAGFPAEVVDAVVSVLCRLAFDLGVWGGGRVPVLVVCEEAHRYVPADKAMGFGPTRRAISRIAKEGRKYGVYLGLVTQRPKELDATILSQCSTIFAMRMANEADHAIIRSAVSDAATSTLAALPSIGNREAIAFGEAVPVPMRVRFAALPPTALPQNRLSGLSTPQSQDAWSEAGSADFLAEVVERWRSAAHRES